MYDIFHSINRSKIPAKIRACFATTIGDEYGEAVRGVQFILLATINGDSR